VLEVRDDEGTDELLAVADDHTLFDDFAGGEGVLDGSRSDVLARREHENLFDALAELDVAVRTQVNDIAGPEPPAVVVLDEGPLGRVRFVPVALDDVRSLDEEFADRPRVVEGVLIGHRFVDAEVHLGKCRTNSPDFGGFGRIDGDDGGRLGEPIPLVNREPHPVIERTEFTGEAAAAADQELDLVTESLPDLCEHESVCEGVFRPQSRPGIVG